MGQPKRVVLFEFRDENLEIIEKKYFGSNTETQIKILGRGGVQSTYGSSLHTPFLVNLCIYTKSTTVALC